ncbi:hypothetical protein FQN57_001725 [Myotisia sp. PD_48]|nr:hypothetical protein FQN57_001725 [Myotisia sp. PD_48]
MATWAYPHLPPDRLHQKEEESMARELEWLLGSLQVTLASLRDGLRECQALLGPNEPGSTLVLSTMRSESVKGFVTRVGSEIVKGDVQLRLSSLPPPRGSASVRLNISTAPTSPQLVLHQLSSVRRLINDCLDVIDVSTFTGDPMDANFICGQLRLLGDYLTEARQTLKGDRDAIRKRWMESSVDENCFDPPLPRSVSFHLAILDAALILNLRTLEPISSNHTPTTSFAPEIGLSGFSLRDKLFGSKQPTHDEAEDVFNWYGDEVRVKEKVRIESQDPSLLSAMAKITALEHEVARWKHSLAIVMGTDETESE